MDAARSIYGGQERCIQSFGGGNLKEIEDLDADGRVILKSIFKKWDWEAGTELIWLRLRTGGGRL
jgi:hypothetical protein